MTVGDAITVDEPAEEDKLATKDAKDAKNAKDAKEDPKAAKSKPAPAREAVVAGRYSPFSLSAVFLRVVCCWHSRRLDPPRLNHLPRVAFALAVYPFCSQPTAS